MWYMHDGAGMWMLFGGIWMVVFWGALIALAVWGIRRLTGRSGTKHGPAPLDTARERYARGEITRDQFEQIRRDLENRD